MDTNMEYVNTWRRGGWEGRGREWRGMYIWREEESRGVCVYGGRKESGGYVYMKGGREWGVCVYGGRKRVEGYVYMEGGREWRGMCIWRVEGYVY